MSDSWFLSPEQKAAHKTFNLAVAQSRIEPACRQHPLMFDDFLEEERVGPGAGSVARARLRAQERLDRITDAQSKCSACPVLAACEELRKSDDKIRGVIAASYVTDYPLEVEESAA